MGNDTHLLDVLPLGGNPLIQEVVGTRVGRYYFPLFAGVAFSRNEFRWSPRIKREAVKNGMQTLRQAALRRLAEGVTTFEEVLRVTGS